MRHATAASRRVSRCISAASLASSLHHRHQTCITSITRVSPASRCIACSTPTSHASHLHHLHHACITPRHPGHFPPPGRQPVTKARFSEVGFAVRFFLRFRCGEANSGIAPLGSRGFPCGILAGSCDRRSELEEGPTTTSQSHPPRVLESRAPPAADWCPIWKALRLEPRPPPPSGTKY